ESRIRWLTGDLVRFPPWMTESMMLTIGRAAHQDWEQDDRLMSHVAYTNSEPGDSRAGTRWVGSPGYSETRLLDLLEAPPTDKDPRLPTLWARCHPTTPAALSRERVMASVREARAKRTSTQQAAARSQVQL